MGEVVPRRSGAVITGHEIVVLDFDGEDGRATMARLDLQPHIISPSGGCHVWVNAPDGPPVRGKSRVDPERFPGMDLQGYGQTATFYGDRPPDGSYRKARNAPKLYNLEDLPAELRKLIKSRQFKKRDLRSPELPEGFADFVPVRELLGEALRRSTAEGRNNMGFILACGLRDEGFSRPEVRDVVVGQYQPLVEVSLDDRPPYTPQEAYDSVISAFSQPPRLPRRAFLSDDIIRMDQVKLEAVRWIWEPWVPADMLAVIDGDKGRLKSTIAYSIVASVTACVPFPGESKGVAKARRPEGCIIFQQEEGLEHTVLPKLLAAGADLHLVRVIRWRTDQQTGRPHPIELPEDLGWIEDKIRSVESEIGLHVGLVVIDPILGYLSEKIHYGNDPQVRRALVPLADTAQRFRTAFLLLRHLNKNINLDAAYRGGGSSAFQNVARVHNIVEWHPDHPSVGVLAMINSNLTRQARSLTYRSVETNVKADGREVETYKVAWGESVDLKANDLTRRKDARKDAPVREELTDWLEKVLAEGPLPMRKVRKQFAAAGYTNWSYLDRKVATAMGVVRTRKYSKKKRVDYWVWELPKSYPGVKFHVSG